MPQVSRRAKALLSILTLLIGGKVVLDLKLYSQYFLDVETSPTNRLVEHLASFRLSELTTTEEAPPSPCAYAFAIGGCNSGDTLCDGFVYNILVATQILRDEGSKHDVVAMFQMSVNSTSPYLAPEHTRALHQMNVKIRYIPSSPLESFFDTVINKFRILQLIEYQRVLLMDGDVIPIGNLDYLFDLSLDGTLNENVVVAGALEPANGGFFMLQPGDYDQLQDVIRKREETSLASPADYKGYKFDELRGWGHVIEPPDQWVARRPGQKGTNWTFHFAFSDQGLLYHWVKYHKRSVSIVFSDKAENWGANGTRYVQLERVLSNPFKNYSKPRIHISAACRKFMCDFMHFVGSKKPWLKRPPKDLTQATQNADAYHIWWYTLKILDEKLDMRLDFSNWKVWQQPPLGGYATLADMEKHAKAMVEARNVSKHEV